MTEAAPPAGVDPHVAVAAAQLLQDLPERRYAGLTLWIVRGQVHQRADPAHLLGSLRARRKRPRDRRAAEQCESRAVSPAISPVLRNGR